MGLREAGRRESVGVSWGKLRVTVAGSGRALGSRRPSAVILLDLSQVSCLKMIPFFFSPQVLLSTLCPHFIFYLFLIGGQLLYSFVLVSAVQNESARSIHISPPS